MASLYLSKVSSCISKCYVPNRAAKMKRYMNDVLIFFNSRYRKIPEENKVYSSYLDKMTELMAYYIDMEIQASSRAKEHPLVVAHKVTASLFIFLDKSPDHILDAILKANNMNRNFWELCSLIFSGVLKETPNRTLSELTYVRYILVYKMWKRVVQGPEDRKNVVTLASLRLKHPPNFVEQIRAGLLNGIIPRISKKRADVTMFLIQAKFDVEEKAKAFLKYVDQSNTNIMFVPTVPVLKTDIPLLVGHLPDFGPAPNLIKSEPPALEENEPQNVDLTCSRLMNEIWTSVNHEASFREAVRMQNVTTYNREEAVVPERKKVLRVLKQRKGNVKNTKSTEHEAVNKQRDGTIVLSDDSDKGGFGKEHPIMILNPKSKSKRDLWESPQIHKREPTPPPKVVSPPPKQVSPPPTPQNYILTPSQIKQERRSALECHQEEAPSPKRALIEESYFSCERPLNAAESPSRSKTIELEGHSLPEHEAVNKQPDDTIVLSDDSDKGELGKELTIVIPNPKSKSKRNLSESPQIHKREPTPPPKVVSPPPKQVSPPPTPQNYILTPSQIKQERRSALECHQEEAPSPKRTRIEVSMFSCERPLNAAESPSRSETVELDGHSLSEHDESLLCGVVHYETLLSDRNLFLSQAKFRDMLTRTGCIGMDVPSPDQVDPETGSIAERCCCPQCKGNNDALQANYRALVEYLASMERARESSVPIGSINADLAGADPEPNPQLPFKKRPLIQEC